MSNSKSVAVAKISARTFLNSLLLGSLLVTATQVMQPGMTRHDAVSHRPNPLRLITAPVRLMAPAPAPVEPSAYDAESGMSSSQLINRWDAFVTEASTRFHIPKDWIRAVMRQESGGRTMRREGRPIVSRAGAVGLMQLVPRTYQAMAAEHKLGANPFDARDNIMAGAAYLNRLYQKYGYPAMFAAYNAGPGRLKDHLEHGASLPAETRAYVGNIAKTLKLQTGKTGLDPVKANFVKLTQPDGAAVKIDPSQVTSIRAARPGEYDWTVKTVLTLGKYKQRAVREDVTVATATIQAAINAS
ncbi:MAG TPA: lytic transglycosylase domain-containing protein [Rhizomicrobium sp.]|nr:lytic transglycosylase domain-containing protein [Rhizomicrobium sp.]